MNTIFIHQNFPAQFKYLVKSYASDPNNQVVAICRDYAPGLRDEAYKTVLAKVYKPSRKPAKDIHHYVYNIESSVLNGQAVASILYDLRKSGFIPDLCIAHIGWGEALYFKDIFPDTPLIAYCEFYYHASGVDADFDPEFPISIDDRLRIRTKNAVTLLSLDSCDIGVSPTHWQHQLFPKEYQQKISIAHEGIDTFTITPDPLRTFTLTNGQTLKKEEEIITFTARSLEPYRGFHIFMRAVEEICRRRPDCHILITGGDDASYGIKLPKGQSYRQKILREVEIDSERVHFLGEVSYPTHIELLQVSTVHVYLTVPFVLSWSMLEAMSAECLVIGSDTPPVREVLINRKNGLLVDFFSHGQISDLVDEVFDHPDRMQEIREQARKDVVERYSIQQALDQYGNLYRRVARD